MKQKMTQAKNTVPVVKKYETIIKIKQMGISKVA